MSRRILIIDDEKDMLALLSRIISERTPHIVTATDEPFKVDDLLKKVAYDIIITDLKMPQRDGIAILELVKEKDPGIAVIMMTAYGTIESAVEATRKGAFDYVTKPFRKERILQVIDQAIKWQDLQRENTYLREELAGSPRFPTLMGTSPAMETLQTQIDRVAKTSATILITGESGTGKELVARAIHTHSLRRDKAFIPINCSTIPESIIESELFGHLRGSFTGAMKDKKGLVEEAEQGTLFLDEIGDLSPVMQVKLLRLIQEGEFKPVGSNRIHKVDARFIAATHQNLPEKIRKGEFREDLFYRLNVINIHLPPLRERMADIPVLSMHFLKKFNAIHSKKIERFSKQAMDYLVEREWQGNVRELENVVERGVVMAADNRIQVEDLTESSQMTLAADSDPMSRAEDIFSLPFKDAKDKLIEAFHSRYINKALAKHSGNVSQAAKEAGLKRQYLHRLMRETNVESKSFKKSDSTK